MQEVASPGHTMMMMMKRSTYDLTDQFNLKFASGSKIDEFPKNSDEPDESHSLLSLKKQS